VAVERPARGLEAHKALQAVLVLMLAATAAPRQHAEDLAFRVRNADRRWVTENEDADVHHMSMCASLGVVALQMGWANFNPTWPLHVHAWGAPSAADTRPPAWGWILHNLLRGMWCATCGRTSRHLRSCARCRSVRYCSVSCQTSGWPEHKHACIS